MFFTVKVVQPRLKTSHILTLDEHQTGSPSASFFRNESATVRQDSLNTDNMGSDQNFRESWRQSIRWGASCIHVGNVWGSGTTIQRNDTNCWTTVCWHRASSLSLGPFARCASLWILPDPENQVEGSPTQFCSHTKENWLENAATPKLLQPCCLWNGCFEEGDQVCDLCPVVSCDL